MSGKQNPSRNPFSDFVFDWKSEDPDFKIKIQISQSNAPLVQVLWRPPQFWLWRPIESLEEVRTDTKMELM